ncbi:MAG: AMP-binding protein, partial [Clostridia bacterium]|nr:AMP-binding protein [Clostridia bacterium]
MVKYGIMCSIFVVVLNTQRERSVVMENKRLQQYREVFETQYTWKEGYMRNVYRYGDKKALSFPETNDSWTYSELNTEVNKLSNAMLEDGVKHGDVVMYLLQNCPVFVFAYVASHKIGAINAPMNYRL